MIFSMIFLFLVMLSAAAFVYYLYVFFIPALKLKNKDYNNQLASNFDFDGTDSVGYNSLSPEEEDDDKIFDSVYRSEVNDEKICVDFNSGLNPESQNNYDDNNLDENKFEKKSRKSSIRFKFWIFCYKLLRARFGESFN